MEEIRKLYRQVIRLHMAVLIGVSLMAGIEIGKML